MILKDCSTPQIHCSRPYSPADPRCSWLGHWYVIHCNCIDGVRDLFGDIIEGNEICPWPWVSAAAVFGIPCIDSSVGVDHIQLQVHKHLDECLWHNCRREELTRYWTVHTSQQHRCVDLPFSPSQIGLLARSWHHSCQNVAVIEQCWQRIAWAKRKRYIAFKDGVSSNGTYLVFTNDDFLNQFTSIGLK